MKSVPDIGACNDEKDCSNNGQCIDNYCNCKLGFDHDNYPKDCSSKLVKNKYTMMHLKACSEVTKLDIHITVVF